MSGLPKLALIAGPTASGKSAAAMALAETHGGVVINADASQVYADLRVLTARPSPSDEAQVSHRLFGHVDAADASYSAARWAGEARAVVTQVHETGRLPVLVGGTGLYVRTLLDGIAPVPAIDPIIREQVRALPVVDAAAALRREDPEAAARLSPNDSARIARALEVVRSTGRPLAAWQTTRSGGIAETVEITAAILLPDRATLRDRIDARAAAMVEAGAMAEVAALVGRTDVPDDAPIRRAIGVPPLAACLAGDISVAEALERLRLDTRRYAKRQYTWFRNQPPAAWHRYDSVDIALQQLATMLRD